VGALAVCDDGRLDQLVGILSERDIVRAVWLTPSTWTRHR
jgi:CBS domain-containing protein